VPKPGSGDARSRNDPQATGPAGKRPSSKAERSAGRSRTAPSTTPGRDRERAGAVPDHDRQRERESSEDRSGGAEKQRHSTRPRGEAGDGQSGTRRDGKAERGSGTARSHADNDSNEDARRSRRAASSGDGSRSRRSSSDDADSGSRTSRSERSDQAGRGRVDPDRTARRSRDRNGPIRTTLIAPGGDRARPATVARHGPPTASTTTAGHGIGRRTVGSPDRTDRVRTRRTGPATGSRGRRSGPRPSVPGWRGPTGSTRRGSRRRSTSTSTPASTRIGTGSGLAPDRDDRPRSSPGSLLRSSVPGVLRGAWPESALGQRHIRPTSLAESAVRSGWPGPTPDHGAPAHYLDVSTTEVAGTAGPLVSPGTRSAERGFHRQRRAADPGRPRAEDHDLRRLAAEMCVISRPRRSQAASLPRSVTARR